MATNHLQKLARVPSSSRKLHARVWTTLATPRCDSHLIRHLAFVEILRHIKEKRGHHTIILYSPKGSHQSNGFVEKSILRVEAMFRALRSQAFASTGIDVTATSPLLPLLVRHAGRLLSRGAVGCDGLTCHSAFAWKTVRVRKPEFP